MDQTATAPSSAEIEWLQILRELDVDLAHERPSFTVTNPATGQIIASVVAADETSVEAAIQGAADALPGWAGLGSKERGDILRRWFDLIRKNRIPLARLLTLEQGKPLTEALGEVDNAARNLDWYAEEGKRVFGEVVPATGNVRSFVFREPIGVCVAITPWNFPASMVTRKVAPALAAGCTVILKPSEFTPLTALALAALGRDAGLPAGVLTVLTIDGPDVARLGEQLLSDPRVAKLSFTGSTRVGRRLSEICARTVKKVSLELGGNAPFIVLDDADIDAAVDGAIATKFRNSGQTCICANRFLVHASVYDEFSQKLAAKAAGLKVAPGYHEHSQQGPLINRAAIEKVSALVENGVQLGAQVLAGGRVSEVGPLFYCPTVLTNVNRTMRMAQEEIFGPVAPLMKFETDEEAIESANGTEYGLACYVYGQNMKRTWKFASRLQFGMIGFNTPSMTNEAAPFGGMKQSGIGREGSHFGIEEYLEIKYVCLA